jgi:amino acid transporter
VVLLSIAGAVNGCILTAARIPFAQARDGMFFSVFGRIHPRFVTPAFAIGMVSLWSGVLILTGTYETLSSYTVLSAWISIRSVSPACGCCAASRPPLRVLINVGLPRHAVGVSDCVD